jgi:UDP-GlcNAc:undecaprenyl-phosphate GlcNAc-1-phosphate transferase
LIINFIVCLFIAFVGTWGLKLLALKYRILAIPNERSMHTVPMPTAGGVGIFLAFLVSLTILPLYYSKATLGGRPAWILVWASLPIVIVGLIDDVYPLDQRPKLVAQILSAALLVSFGVRIETIAVPLLGTLPLGYLSIPFTMLVVVALINFYNFMDGVDGMAAGEGVIAGLFLAIMFMQSDLPVLSWISLAMAGGCLGFLMHNFPPAKIFMGDVASGFLGFSFGALAILGSQDVALGVPFIVPMLLLGNFIFDAGGTVLRRMIQGEAWTQPHKHHYCQRLVTLGYGHRRVALLEYGVAGLLGISGMIYLKSEEVMQAGILVGWGLLLSVGIGMIARMERRRGAE